MDDRDPKALEAQKRATTFQVLMRVARLVNERSMARMNAKSGRKRFGQAAVNLVPHIAWEGSRISDLAARVGVSKQAVSKLVAELEREGVVMTLTDPSDGRARLVRFTDEGMATIRDGLLTLREVERELEDAIGADRLTRLGEDLGVLLRAIEGAGESAPEG